MSRQISLLLLILGLIQLPLYRGGNADWPPIFLATCASLSLLLLSFSASQRSFEPPHISRSSVLPFVLWGMWLAWLTIQIVPLSREALTFIAPYSVPFHDAVAEAGGAARYTISVAPAASTNLLIQSFTYFTLYLAVAIHASKRKSAQLILWAVFLTACAEAIYGSLHELAGIAYAFLDVPGRHPNVATGTFANRNHFAAYCTLGFASGLALMLGKSSPNVVATNWRTHLKQILDLLSSSTVLIRIGLIGLVVGVVLSRSRMGNVALAAGITSFALAWLLTTRQQRGVMSAMLLFLSIALADILLISNQFGLERVLQRLESTDLNSEIRAVGNSMSKQLMQQTGLAGSGLGSFSNVAETVRPQGLSRMFRHAHNDYYQFTIEAGRIGTAVMAAFLICHILLALNNLKSRRRHQRAIAAAGLMIIAAGLLHATVEFNFQIPAYAATFITILALLSSKQKRSLHTPRHDPSANKHC